ncbi:hypothetical protein MNV_850001 [Candidatus Methanoperedens nitroreducens]|uniref:Uncharacterized protein n=1 Tax=Candidatus Methanoperedens nitratireducens TaxID=1392998 RepID=A0A284VTX9_9EURY|nr:hypothetical protein MNV_850001 [Candidatus Methanoperedens nitroreducens]
MGLFFFGDTAITSIVVFICNTCVTQNIINTAIEFLRYIKTADNADAEQQICIHPQF